MTSKPVPPSTPPPSPPPPSTPPPSPPPPQPAPPPRPGGPTRPFSGARNGMPSPADEGAGAGPASRRVGVREGDRARREFDLPQLPEFQVGTADCGCFLCAPRRSGW